MALRIRYKGSEDYAYTLGVWIDRRIGSARRFSFNAEAKDGDVAAKVLFATCTFDSRSGPVDCNGLRPADSHATDERRSPGAKLRRAEPRQGAGACSSCAAGEGDVDQADAQSAGGQGAAAVGDSWHSSRLDAADPREQLEVDCRPSQRHAGRRGGTVQ